MRMISHLCVQFKSVDSFHFLTSLRPCLSVQIIQRQLEQVEEKQRQLEERGVAVEKALRGEAGNGWSLDLQTCFFFNVFFQ